MSISIGSYNWYHNDDDDDDDVNDDDNNDNDDDDQDDGNVDNSIYIIVHDICTLIIH